MRCGRQSCDLVREPRDALDDGLGTAVLAPWVLHRQDSDVRALRMCGWNGHAAVRPLISAVTDSTVGSDRNSCTDTWTWKR